MKVRQAAALINQGMLEEAEKIYRGLISEGMGNYIIYGNLAGLLQIKGDMQNSIVWLKEAIKLNPNYPDAHNNLGNALKEQGDLTAAIASYNKALKLNPNYSDAHNNLGNALKEQGDLIAAINSYNNALKFKPNSSDAYFNLGNVLKEQGDITAAIDSYNNALKLKPNYPDAYNNLGNAFKEQGDITAAIDSYNSALKLKPNFSNAYFNRGNALKEDGDLIAAISSYKNALKFRPNYLEAHINLGHVLKEHGDLYAAITSYKNVVQLNPSSPDAYYNLGIAFQDYGDLEEALTNYRKSLDIDPTFSKALYGIGLIHAAKGNFEASKLSFYKAIEFDSDNTSALFELSKDISSVKDLKKLTRMLDKPNMSRLSKRSQSMLYFAQANRYHKLEEYHKAAHYLINANRLKISCDKSDLSAQLLCTKQITAYAKKIDVALSSSDGVGKIFIVGVPRCGSTLLESVLATNSNICDLGESRALTQAFYQIKTNKKAQGRKLSLLDAYTEKIDQPLNKYTYVVDKYLYNFRLIEAIARAMPGAKVIHCRRHPLDNVLSMMRSNLQAGNNYTADPLDAAKFIMHSEEIMRSFKARFGHLIYTFDYDAFVNDPEKTLHPLLEWLNLEWDYSYLHHEKSHRFINTSSVVQVRKPINNNSVGAWTNYTDLLKSAEIILRNSGLFVCDF